MMLLRTVLFAAAVLGQVRGRRTRLRLNKNTGGYQDLLVVIGDELDRGECPQILDNVKVSAWNSLRFYCCFSSKLEIYKYPEQCYRHKHSLLMHQLRAGMDSKSELIIYYIKLLTTYLELLPFLCCIRSIPNLVFRWC